MTDQHKPHTGPVAGKDGVPTNPVPGLYSSLVGTVTFLDPDAFTTPISEWWEAREIPDGDEGQAGDEQEKKRGER